MEGRREGERKGREGGREGMICTSECTQGYMEAEDSIKYHLLSLSIFSLEMGSLSKSETCGFFLS